MVSDPGQGLCHQKPLTLMRAKHRLPTWIHHLFSVGWQAWLHYVVHCLWLPTWAYVQHCNLLFVSYYLMHVRHCHIVNFYFMLQWCQFMDRLRTGLVQLEWFTMYVLSGEIEAHQSGLWTFGGEERGVSAESCSQVSMWLCSNDSERSGTTPTVWSYQERWSRCILSQPIHLLLLLSW